MEAESPRLGMSICPFWWQPYERWRGDFRAMPRWITGRLQAGSVCKNFPLRKLPSILRTTLVPSEGSAHNDLITLFRTPAWMSSLLQCDHVSENVSITPMSTRWWLDFSSWSQGKASKPYPNHSTSRKTHWLCVYSGHRGTVGGLCENKCKCVYWYVNLNKVIKTLIFQAIPELAATGPREPHLCYAALNLPWWWASHCAANSEAEGWERTVKILWLWKL